MLSYVFEFFFWMGGGGWFGVFQGQTRDNKQKYLDYSQNSEKSLKIIGWNLNGGFENTQGQ